jgi:hypothetical protein
MYKSIFIILFLIIAENSNFNSKYNISITRNRKSNSNKPFVKNC